MFRYSICKPLEPEIIQMGAIDKEAARSLFDNFPWLKLLKQYNNAAEKDIHYSPSLEIENQDNQHNISISIVGDENQQEYYIFYKRPEIRKSFFGFFNRLEKNYLTERTGQNKEAAQLAFQALIDNQLEVLKKHWG